MGMFDNVEFEKECWNCGQTLDDWQTKDTACTLSTIQIQDCRNLYTYCPRCRAWNEYSVVPLTWKLEPVHSEEYWEKKGEKDDVCPPRKT